MRTVADRIQTAITQQQAEVDRLAKIATTDLPAAQAKLTALQGMLAAVTPEIEAGYANCRAMGIALDTA